MARSARGIIMPDRQLDKREITWSGDQAVAAANELVIYIGDDVGLYRQVEIINGLRWLWNGVRDRDLLNPNVSDPTFGPLYTVCHIDHLNTTDRRTSWDTLTFTEDDIGIGIGINVFALRATNMVENGFRMLRDYALENKALFVPTP